MSILLAIVLTGLSLALGIALAHAQLDGVEDIEALVKMRGGTSVAARLHPFLGQRCYEVTYRDPNGAERLAHCHIDFSGRIYLCTECEDPKS